MTRRPRVVVPQAFKDQHGHIWRRRVVRGGSPIRGWPPEMRTPWGCTCGASGREGGERAHREHVRDAYLDSQQAAQ
jgi:hypothetical protein